MPGSTAPAAVLLVSPATQGGDPEQLFAITASRRCRRAASWPVNVLRRVAEAILAGPALSRDLQAASDRDLRPHSFPVPTRLSVDLAVRLITRR